MKYNFIFFILGLLLNNQPVFAQTQKHSCNVELVQLQFDKTIKLKEGIATDSLLLLAKETSSILLHSSEIKKLIIQTDTACCIYAGLLYGTYHHYLLTKETATRLYKLNIPLCCGIPVVLKVDNKEIYRAMLWNPISSFVNNSITMTLIQDTITVTNQLPIVADFRNDILANKNSLLSCLIDK